METNSSKVNTVVKYFGIALILLGAILFTFSFKDIFISEVKYVTKNIDIKEVSVGDTGENIIDNENVVLNKDFGIYIPKIGANAKIIPDVDPFDKLKYSKALVDGVAHSNTSVKPGQSGNIFLFAHSAQNFYESRKYNVYFYLLPKLNKGDKIYISYKSKLYTYEVEDIKYVSKDDISYLGNYKNYNTLTLMTCWPAGLNIKRVIIEAKKHLL